MHNKHPLLSQYTKPTALTIPVLVVIFMGMMAILQPLFFSADNIINVANQYAYIAIFAMAQYYVLLVKGLDLAQGGIIALAGVSAAAVSQHLGLPGAFFTGLVVAIIAGFTNGFIVSVFRVSPFVVTLGIGYLCTGLALLLSGGSAVYDVPNGYDYLGWAGISRVPLVFSVLVFLCLVHVACFRYLHVSRYLFAVGSNVRAAQHSGIPVRRTTIAAYAIGGAFVGIGAMFLSSRINSGHPTEGASTALQSVAACVIGGVSLFGGRGKLLGVLLGALFLALLSNSLNFLNISSYVQQVLVGVIIVVAVILDRIRHNE